ncbi:MAG: prenyltransferase [Bacteroidetes bacterium]|nr:prenyltransferase [Bacteroidota bacterium]
MTQTHPGFARMTRLPFLSSILSPLIAGTLLAVLVGGAFDVVNFVVVLAMGVALHIATNVYNDIYDTLQGTDRINVHRNEFSGGSGVLVDRPDLLPVMYRIARLALLAALVAAAVLAMRVDASLRIHVIVLYALSAFFSKYYTAAPVKLAYRGWGEVSVCFAFGPMAILIATVSQNVGFHPAVIAAMPMTGISTLSILLVGQMIDRDADRDTGKWGIAVRAGRKSAALLYAAVQLLLCVNIIVLSLVVPGSGWPILLALLPCLLLLPRIIPALLRGHDDMSVLKPVAGRNVQLHLLFSVALSVGLGVALLL